MTDTQRPASITEHFLLPSRPLQAFLDHVEPRTAACSRAELIERWRDARMAMTRLEERESGCADEAAILAVPQEMAAHVAAVTADPSVNRAFDRVPVMFGLIDIDATMCASAVSVGETLAAMNEHWPEAPDDAALVRACLPLGPRPSTGLRASFDGRTLSLTGDDEDLCRLDDALITGDEALASPGAGTVDAVLQLRFGRPPALLHAARLRGRLLLVEGHHRAQVLRARGEQYLPCLVSECADLDDVRDAAPALRDIDLARFFEAPRPPMLRDFARSALVHRYAATPLRRLLRLRLELTSQWVP